MERRSRFNLVTHKVEVPDRTLQDYLAMVLRGRWIIALTFVAVLAASALYTFLSDPVYVASARVLINRKYLRSSSPFDFEAFRGTILQDPVRNEIEILKSSRMSDSAASLLMAVRYLDSERRELIPLLAQPSADSDGGGIIRLEQISRRLRESVSFEPARDADVIVIKGESKDRREAALIANTYAQAYSDLNLYLSRARSRSLRTYLHSQLAEREKTLDQAEVSMKDYMKEKGVVSLDAEATKVVEQLSQLEAARDAVDVDIKSVAQRIASYRQQISEQERTVAAAMEGSGDPYIRLLQDQIAKLEVQRDITIAQNPSIAKSDVYGATLKEIESQIASLQERLKERTTEFIKNVTPAQAGDSRSEPAGYLREIKQRMLSAELDIQSLLAKRDALNAAIQDYERQFGRIPERNMRYARLERTKSSNEKLYLMLEEKYNQARLSEESEFGYVEIIDHAGPPNKPSYPKPLINLVFGAMFGIGLGFAIVVVRELADKRVQTPEDIKKVGLAVVSTVARMRDELKQVARRAGGKVNGKGSRAPLVAVKNPFSSVTESYRLLRTNLELSNRNRGVQTLLITSANAGEGKSTTASNLAIVIAQAGRRVLLVDADLRQPVLHMTFDVKQKPGLSEFLVGASSADDVIQPCSVKNLWLLSSGTMPVNPAELLSMDTTRENLELLKREFDLVIVDSPPVLAVTDPCVISRHVDAVFLVVSSGVTRLVELDRAVDMISQIHGKMPGVVLNNFDAHRAYGVVYGRKGYGYYGESSAYHRAGQNGSARQS